MTLTANYIGITSTKADTPKQTPTKDEFVDTLYNHPEKKHLSFDIDDGCLNVTCSASMYDAINIIKKGKIVTFAYRFSFYQWAAGTELKGNEEPKQMHITKSQFDCKKQRVRDWNDGALAETWCPEDDQSCKVEKSWHEAGWDDWQKFDDHKGLKHLFKQLCK
jgi:hypothetical protein